MNNELHKQFLRSRSRKEEKNYEVIDLNNLPSLLTVEGLSDENDEISNMTSLNELLLFSHSEANWSNYPENQQYRLSLAHEKLRRIPKIIVNEMAHQVKFLDLSYNEFDNLDFLSEFENLETFICDHNYITASTHIPYLPKLDFLWFNYCKIGELYPWAKKLQSSCPNLLHLSLMGNPAALSYLNGGSSREHLEYRYFIISMLPNLIYLDDKAITRKERQQAELMYNRPIFERVSVKNSKSMPKYVRLMAEKISELCSPVPSFAIPQRNTIV